ncbi:MAG: DNA adenine methylase [Prevotellaceae bacterium]|jgi:DNA adenine methylase|nr:DNA adenine methylase [Prevotellaceae bacterium]
MIKSPLRYPGSKSRAVETIAKLRPNFDEFREPFLGGGSVFISAKQRYPNKKTTKKFILTVIKMSNYQIYYE